jgi:DNA-binding CsgD family transcriptional regulator
MRRQLFQVLLIPPTAAHGLGGSSLLNQQVGGELGISWITVKARRGKVRQKMKADSLADLVKIAAKLREASAPKS